MLSPSAVALFFLQIFISNYNALPQSKELFRVRELFFYYLTKEMQYQQKIALSLSILHFGLQLTYRTYFISPCTNHFVKH